MLTAEDIDVFERDGFLAPLTLCSPQDMARLRAHIDQRVLTTKSPIASCGIRKSRHLDDRVVFELAAHPRLLECAAAILEGDVVLWRSQFFVKNPGDREIPWHHDGHFLKLTPIANLSVWIAIDPADETNACLQVIPGSHRREIRHVPAPSGMEFSEMADPACFDAGEALNVPLLPGQFILFKDRLLHHSHANLSQRRRLGLAIRFTHTGVRIDLHKTSPGQYGIVVRGQDKLGVNHYLPPPI